MLLLAPLTPIVYIYIFVHFLNQLRELKEIFIRGFHLVFSPLFVISRSGACLSDAARTKFMGVEKERWKKERLIFIGAVAQISRESALVTSRNTVGVLCSDPERIVTGKIRIFLCEKRTSCGRRQFFNFSNPWKLSNNFFQLFPIN